MATINGLTTLNVADVTASDYLPIYDASAATDKKTALMETGTWTPVLNFGGATTGITYNTQVGTYTRIGRIVLASCYIYLSNKGSATGNATVTGLPYSAVTYAGQYYTGAMYWSGMAATGYSMMCFLPQASATIAIHVSSAGSATAAATQANFSNSTGIIITLMYDAAAT